MSGFPRLLRGSRASFGRMSAENYVGSGFGANFSRLGSTQLDRRSYTNPAGPRTVRIGCASGFWGDTATSVPQLIFGGNLDFLVFDYLSEITMSLLTAARTKTPDLGYAPDFVQAALAPFINDIHRKGIRVVSNAGGVNPLACAAAIQEVVRKAGLDLKVAVVTGDDLMPHRHLLSAVKMADDGAEGQQTLPKTLHSMNAYLGAEPIRRCLDRGAHIVVTGRCVDSAVALGPLMHTFGWKSREFDLLAAGRCQCGHCGPMDQVIQSVCCQELEPFKQLLFSLNAPAPHILCGTGHPGFAGCCLNPYVLKLACHTFREQHGPIRLQLNVLAGHLIECGAQSTGGIFTDWHQVPDWDNMGFPVVQCWPDGTFVLSKPPRTGGLVSFGTAAEQLVYELGDPRRYLLPDVTCDFSRVEIQEVPGVEGGAVRVSGARGFPPSHDYKVCATYMDGFRATAVCPVGGPRAAEKSRRTADSIIKRTKRVFHQLGLEDFHAVNVQVLGAEDAYGPNARCKDSREAVLWMAVHHKQKKALEIFSREVAPAGTGMAPGLTGIVGGRPKVSPVLKPFFFLLPKSQTKVDIHISGQLVETLSEAGPDPPEQDKAPPTSEEDEPDTELPSGPHTYRLQDLAYTRSGDKGDSANIGVIARHPLYFPYLKQRLTSSVVEDYFSHLIEPGQSRAVTRYSLPGIHGLNFVLRRCLGGGGVASLRSDPQGKAFGQMLLDLELQGLPDLKSLVD